MTVTVRDYAQRYPQHGYRHITALMQRDGHLVNHKRIERLWRQEGLQLPRRKTVKRRHGEKAEANDARHTPIMSGATISPRIAPSAARKCACGRCWMSLPVRA